MASRQIKTFATLLGLAASAALGALIASRTIESPADVAARTAPPAPSPILVPIERRVLSTDIVARGTARFGRPIPLSVVPSNLKVNPGRIATLPLRSAAVEEGQVILTASGRPVLVLAGTVPTFRDLGPGVVGDDVRLLEEALARLGFAPGPIDGTYDAATARAVAAWYSARGFEPFGPTREQQAVIATLERDWADAMRAKLAATAAAAAAAEGVAVARAAGDQLIGAASLENATRAADRRTAGENGRAGASLRVDTERARAELAMAAAEAELRARIAERATIVLDPRQPEMARLQAEAQLETARSAHERARLDGELAVRTAEQESQLGGARQRQAEITLRSARLEAAKLVRAAADAQKIADFDAALAIERADRLAAELAQAKARIGVQVPADELVFIPSLPVRVEEIIATIGSPASGPVLSVTDNQLAVDSALPVETAPLVRLGMPVAIDERALGVRARGTVQMIDGSPGTRGVDGFHFYMEVKVEEAPMRLEGLSVRLTIPVESTAGAVLAVPVTAVSLGADGGSRVQVLRNGTLDYIAVTPGLSAGGFVEIRPLSEPLEPGQMVVVGYQAAEAAPAR